MISNTDNQKQLNDLFASARKNTRTDKCFYCGNKIKSDLCMSHSVPKHVLESIDLNGYVIPAAKLNNNASIFKEYTGVKQAGTFQLICRKCDSEIFSDYENKNNYISEPTQKMMSQIAMKNYLLSIQKRILELYIYENIAKEQSVNLSRRLFSEIIAKRFDLDWYKEQYDVAKKRNNKSDDSKYNIIYYKHLEYVVPFATQFALPIKYGLNGTIINDTYNIDPSYKCLDLHVCIFPFKEDSAVLLFIDESAEYRYSKFIKSFNELSEYHKQLLITYIVFLYSEDVYVSPKLNRDIFKNEIMEYALNSIIYISKYPAIDPYLLPKRDKDVFDLNRYSKGLNLLSSEYQINKL